MDLNTLEARAKAVVDWREAYLSAEDGSVAESEAYLNLDRAGEALDELGDPAVIILALCRQIAALTAPSAPKEEG